MTLKLDIQSGSREPLIVVPPISPSGVMTFSPPGQEAVPDDQRIVYRVRPPSFRSRAVVDHETMAVSLKVPGDEETNSAALAAIERVVTAAQRDEVRDVLAGFQALLDNPEHLKDDVEARTALIRQARDIHAQLTPYDSRLQQIVADRVFAAVWKNFVKVKHHICGWSNVVSATGKPVVFEIAKGHSIVSEELLGQIPNWHISAISTFLDGLTVASEAVEKN